MLSIILLRHGKTEGNESGRYNGVTDDPLSKDGAREAEAATHWPEIERVYASPLQRTRQTAKICFPNAEHVVVDNLREMDFGSFEGKNADELVDNPDYIAWVEGGCVGLCPGGESIPLFAKRAAAAFAGAVEDAIARGEERVGFSVHGGIIMSVMSAFTGSDEPYHAWYVRNCSGYELTIDEETWANEKRFASYRMFGQKGDRWDLLGDKTKAQGE